MNPDTPLLLIMRLDDGRRTFTKGHVVPEDGTSFVVHFEDVSVLDVGSETELYREGGDALIVQNYLVLNREKVSQGGAQLKVTPVGEPRPFDHRRSKRILSGHAMIVAEFAGESNCIVVDVGDESLGITARPGHSVGDILDLVIDMAFTEFMGTVTVCSVTEDGPDRTRYGVVCEDVFQDYGLRQLIRRLKPLIQSKSP